MRNYKGYWQIKVSRKNKTVKQLTVHYAKSLGNWHCCFNNKKSLLGFLEAVNGYYYNNYNFLKS